MAIFVGLIPQFHYVKKCKYLKIMVWGPTSRASAKSTKLFDRLKPMNSYRVISQLTYEKEKNQFWELFKNGQCPLATPSQPTVLHSTFHEICTIHECIHIVRTPKCREISEKWWPNRGLNPGPSSIAEDALTTELLDWADAVAKIS